MLILWAWILISYPKLQYLLLPSFYQDMLDNANSTGYITCQASNFLRSFRQIPQGIWYFKWSVYLKASGLGLTETPADDQKSLVRLMENFNRFILEQLHQESISNPNVDESHISVSIRCNINEKNSISRLLINCLELLLVLTQNV